MQTQGAPAGWHADPWAAGQLRYWDGSTWTEHTHTPAFLGAQEPKRPRRIGGLSTAATVLVAAQVLLSFASTVLLLMVFADPFLVDWYRDPNLGYEALTRSQAALAATSDSADLLALLSYWVAAVVVMVWLWTARANAEALSARPHTRSRHWAWAGWIVPVVNLWFPYQVVRDVDSASDPRTAHQADASTRRDVGAWWTFFVAGIVITFLWSFFLASSTDAPPTGAVVAMGVVATTTDVATAALFIRIVRRIRFNQEALMSAQHRSQPGGSDLRPHGAST